MPKAESSVPFGVESYSDRTRIQSTSHGSASVFSAFRRGVLFGHAIATVNVPQVARRGLRVQIPVFSAFRRGVLFGLWSFTICCAKASLVFSAFRRGVLFGLIARSLSEAHYTVSSVPFGVESYSDRTITPMVARSGSGLQCLSAWSPIRTKPTPQSMKTDTTTSSVPFGVESYSDLARYQNLIPTHTRLQCLSAWSPIRTQQTCTKMTERAAASLQCLSAWSPIRTSTPRWATRSSLAMSSVPFGVESYSDNIQRTCLLTLTTVFSAFRRGVLFGHTRLQRWINRISFLSSVPFGVESYSDLAEAASDCRPCWRLQCLSAWSPIRT